MIDDHHGSSMIIKENQPEIRTSSIPSDKNINDHEKKPDDLEKKREKKRRR